MNSSNNTKINEDNETYLVEINESTLVNEIFLILDTKEFVQKIEIFISQSAKNQFQLDLIQNESLLKEFILSVSYICNFVHLHSNLKNHQSLLLRTIAFNKPFLRILWQIVNSLTTKSTSNQDLYLLQMLASGSCPEIYLNHMFQINAPLSTFCSLYNLFLLPILDEELLKGEAIFSKNELIKMSSILKDACIGIIDFMHPATYFNNFKENQDMEQFDLAKNFNKKFTSPNQVINLDTKIKAKYFTHLFQVACQLVQTIHTRDIRLGFCTESHWISNSKYVTANRLLNIFQNHDPSILTSTRFGQSSYIFQDESEMDFKLSVNDIRSLTILQELPFTIPFKERVQILENSNGNQTNNLFDSTYKIRIRRDYLYEDAFENLSLDNAPNFKANRIVIEMINQLGLDEAGIDGGGVFREFLLKLLETAFDPNRGIFILTSDGFCYPNPNVKLLFENFEAHYFFLGRILGKVKYFSIIGYNILKLFIQYSIFRQYNQKCFRRLNLPDFSCKKFLVNTQILALILIILFR